jgi:hypothetical protein
MHGVLAGAHVADRDAVSYVAATHDTFEAIHPSLHTSWDGLSQALQERAHTASGDEA